MATSTNSVTVTTSTANPAAPAPSKLALTLTSRKFMVALSTTLSALAAQIGSGASWSPVSVLQIATPLLVWMVIEGAADALERAAPVLAPLVELVKPLVLALVPPGQMQPPAEEAPPTPTPAASQAANELNDLARPASAPNPIAPSLRVSTLPPFGASGFGGGSATAAAPTTPDAASGQAPANSTGNKQGS